MELPSALATGALLGIGIGNLKLLPLAILPGLANSFIYNQYKNTKKEELTQPTKRVDFQI
ncbi:hypothetical protein CMI39_00755 [Candidatus Pacearchaeota archaeon]|jgi:hypothetical protein|nr:hypothetical protein [Candidatus Pacearchaeota archaeon]|tara:strand:- start:8702 stop:8881 length:180 start_codon:yes stop_codon:yes gene_type:complete